jgi:hypothetical protein
VLWFQSPKMACNALTAADKTLFTCMWQYSWTLRKKIPHLQTLGLDSPSNSYNWKNELQEYVYIYPETN